MALSNYNRWHDRVLATPGLTVAGIRLALALDRELLGWNKTEDALGEERLRKTSRLDGRTFARARTELVECGLLDFTPGSPGRGHRATYRLVLDETPGVERGMKTPAGERAFTQDGNPRSDVAETPALQHEKPRPTAGTQGSFKGKKIKGSAVVGEAGTGATAPGMPEEHESVKADEGRRVGEAITRSLAASKSTSQPLDVEELEAWEPPDNVVELPRKGDLEVNSRIVEASVAG